jgi:hypothetical protein
MFKKKVQEVVEEVKVVHPNPNSDPVCAGCNKPINTVTVREDGNSFHNQYCLNDFQNK